MNGQTIEAPAGTTVLEAARQAAIDIPTLCDHPALKPIGACRMCVVEIEGQRTLQTACTFPIGEGMVIQTESPRVVNARKLVLDLIFSERNHFCMYCEASGHCELQSLGYRYNLKNWAYPTYTKPFPVDSSHQFYLMEHNRCILCWRCLRGCGELAANHTLGLGKRGARTVINADLESPLGKSSCVSCGTCVQLCPTGALFDKRSAFMCKDEETESVKSTCSHCSVGCGIEILTRYGNVVRINGDWDAPVNRGVLCRYGRFEPLYNDRERLAAPMIRLNGRPAARGWDEALQEAAARIKSAGDGGLGVLVSSRATNEALYVASRLFGGLKAAGMGLLNPAAANGLGRKASLGDIAMSDLILVAGVDPVTTLPVASFLIKRAVDRGTKLVVAGDGDNALGRFAGTKFSLAEIGKAVELARGAEKPIILYGSGINAQAAEALKSLGGKASFLALEDGVNTNYAAALGFKSGPAPRAVKVLYVLAADERELRDSLAGVGEDTFVIVQASYKSPWGERAHIALPSAIWSEQSGTLTNTEGRVQKMNKAVEPAGEARADWEVLALLAGKLGVDVGGVEEIAARAGQYK
jgi:formate dehydrogenase major subunit